MKIVFQTFAYEINEINEINEIEKKLLWRSLLSRSRDSYHELVITVFLIRQKCARSENKKVNSRINSRLQKLSKEFRNAMMKFHNKVIKVYDILQTTIKLLSKRVALSKRKVLEYWEIDIEKNSERNLTVL